MSELSCQQCCEHAAELALGVLCGRDRDEVLQHLHRCTACQRLVCELMVIVEKLLELLPEVDPPARFDQRVIDAVIPPPRAQH